MGARYENHGGGVQLAQANVAGGVCQCQVDQTTGLQIPAGNEAALMKPSGTLLNQAQLLSRACCLDSPQTDRLCKAADKADVHKHQDGDFRLAGEADAGRRR